MAATPAAKAALSNILSIKLEANPEQIANAVLKFWHDKPETSIIVNTSGKVQAEFLYQNFFIFLTLQQLRNEAKTLFTRKISKILLL